MQFENKDLQPILEEIKYLNGGKVEPFNLDFTSNPEGDQYKIILNMIDETDSWDLYVTIWTLTELVYANENKIITHLHLSRDESGKISQTIDFYNGDVSNVKKYHPFENRPKNEEE